MFLEKRTKLPSVGPVAASPQDRRSGPAKRGYVGKAWQEKILPSSKILQFLHILCLV